MRIEDGKGNGNFVEVNSQNRLSTDAITSSKEHYRNHKYGTAFQVPFNETANNESSCIFYLKNTDSMDISIEGLKIYSSAAGKLDFYVGLSGTPSNVTTLTAVNCNVGSGNTADALIYSGTSILSLTGGNKIESFRSAAAGNTSNLNFEQDIILPKNKTFAIYSGVSGIVYEGTLIFNYHEAL